MRKVAAAFTSLVLVSEFCIQNRTESFSFCVFLSLCTAICPPPLLCQLTDRRVLLCWNNTWSKNNNCSPHFPYVVAECSKSAFGVSFGWAWPRIPHLVLAFTYLSSLKCGTGSALYTTGKLMLHFIVLRFQMMQTERKKNK